MCLYLKRGLHSARALSKSSARLGGSLQKRSKFELNDEHEHELEHELALEREYGWRLIRAPQI